MSMVIETSVCFDSDGTVSQVGVNFQVILF